MQSSCAQRVSSQHVNAQLRVQIRVARALGDVCAPYIEAACADGDWLRARRLRFAAARSFCDPTWASEGEIRRPLLEGEDGAGCSPTVVAAFLDLALSLQDAAPESHKGSPDVCFQGRAAPGGAMDRAAVAAVMELLGDEQNQTEHTFVPFSVGAGPGLEATLADAAVLLIESPKSLSIEEAAVLASLFRGRVLVDALLERMFRRDPGFRVDAPTRGMHFMAMYNAARFKVSSRWRAWFVRLAMVLFRERHQRVWQALDSIERDLRRMCADLRRDLPLVLHVVEMLEPVERVTIGGPRRVLEGHLRRLVCEASKMGS